MREGRRFRFLLAMNCQVAAEAAEGAEAPYSGAPAVLEYGTAGTLFGVAPTIPSAGIVIRQIKYGD
jgi:hypothetical protein